MVSGRKGRNSHRSFEHTLEEGRPPVDRSCSLILANSCAVGFREELSLAWSVGSAVHGAPPVF